ncbi:uncharacterized protein LOC144446291 [Glandiceps talaboti]
MARSLAKDVLWLLLGLTIKLCDSNLVRVKPNQEYVYKYDAESQLEGVGTFLTTAKLGVYLLEDVNNGQHCKLHVIYMKQYVDHDSSEGEVNPHSRDWDFSQWFSFVISRHGEILSVYYPSNENMEILTMKKMLVGLFTSKMHTSNQVMTSGKEWTYKVNEMGHEGEHESTYTATPSSEGLVFRRQKHGHIVPNANVKNEKEILYHSSLQLPHTIHIEESFSSPRSAPSDFDMFAGVPGDKKRKQEEVIHDYTLPEMATSSTGTLQFMNIKELPSNTTVVAPSNLISDSIKISMYSKPPVPLEELDGLIKGNMTCMRKNKIIESAERSNCFNNLVAMVAQLSAVNTTVVAERYIKDNVLTEADVENRGIFIDVLGGIAMETTQMLLTEMVLLSKNPNPELVYRAMVHFVALTTPPPDKFVDTLKEIAFHQKFTFPDPKNTTNVRHRALLVLGSVAKVIKKTNPEKAQKIVNQLEDTLGVHDPWKHRHTRSTLSDDEYDTHLHYKANLIHALGNAAFDSSYDYFISYMNNTGSPSLLRRSGVFSVGRYSHEQAANTLLDIAVHDDEEHVRYTATLEYQKHPYALELTDLMQEYVAVHTNQTHIHGDEESNRPLARSRRAIFKDFDFDLKLPFIDWSKTIGNKHIGGSVGFIMKNFLTLSLKKFNGNLDVHVEDGAWARAHLGILGVNVEFLNARLCFKGSGSYGLNILQEYGFDDVAEVVELYDDVVKKVIDSVKNTIKRFKNLLSLTKGNVNEIFDDFVEVIEDLPNRVKNFRNIAKNLVKKIAEYTDLPDFITDIKNVIDRVNTLLHDIKTDVMEFYNAIVDGVKVTLPWAAQQIEDAIKAAAQAVKKLFKSPRSSISDIAKSIYKIKAAIAGVLDAKTRIEDACFFKEGQHPYWFDLDDEIEGIWEDILKVKQNLENSIDWIREGFSDDTEDPFKHFTGVPLSTVRRQIIDEILGVVDDIFAPLTKIKQVSEPFVLAYDSLIGTIEDIKNGYEDVKRGYETAKSFINKIFGPKIGEAFPNEIMDSSCGDGDYPSTNENTLPGVDLFAEEGSEIVAPFQGVAKVTGVNQVTLTLTSELTDIEVILFNVALNSDRDGHPVNKNEVIGKVTSSGCIPNTIHFSMRSKKMDEYINPTRYFEKREMPPPGWTTYCDDYILAFKGEIIAEGSITDGPKEKDTSPDRTTEPDTSDLDDITSSRRKRDIIGDFFDGAKDFVDSLGLPGIDELGPVFDFNMKDLKLGQVYDFLVDVGLDSLKDRLESLLERLKSAINNEECKRPESMDIKELRYELELRGKPTTGSREALIERYFETEEKCFGLRNALTKNIYCTFDDHCLGISCCMDLKFFHFHRSFTAYVQYDPCSFQLKLGADSWSKTFDLIDIDFAVEDSESTVDSVDILDAVQVIIKYKISKNGGKIFVDLETGLCSTEVDECLPFIKILDNAKIDIPFCDEDMQAYIDTKNANSDSGGGIDTKDLTLGQLEDMLDQFLIDEDDVTQLMKDLRKFYQDLVKEAIDTTLSGLFDDKFTGFDKCLNGDIYFGHGATFYSYTVLFMVGPIPMYFGFGAGGNYGMSYGTSICLLSMTADLSIKPQVGAQAYGHLGIWLFVLFGELRLTGYIMQTTFPTRAEVQYDHFPIEVGARMDMNLVPLRVELRMLLIFELKIKIGWVKIHIRKVLINKVLWEYTTPMISGTLLDIGDLEPDNTPPVFKPFVESPFDLFSEEGGGAAGFKRRHAIGERDIVINQGCTVRQLEGRDYTDPAFELELAVEDDRSEVDLSFCVGTYKGGCDILKDQPMGGFSTIVSQVLRGGVPFYFTVTAVNSAKVTTKATCEIPTYDVTLPGGRVTPDFRSTSHPSILKASAVALDDSVISQREEAVGFGLDVLGYQVSDWAEFDIDKNSHDIDVGLDPLGTKSLEYFAGARLGRLKSVTHHTAHYLYPQNCAKDCLALPPTKCLSFNYDYGDSGLCELLEEIEGHEVELHETGYFYNFERLGIGHTVEFTHSDLVLRHNDLHFFNLHLNNVLGYRNVISSKSILVDFVPPEPGPISNAVVDEVLHETCLEFVPDEWESRCIEETPLPNHRSIIDGPGSMCAFNGHEPLVDMLYTRANKYVSANWDGFRDNETDIFGYTWTVGTDHCEDDVHPHKDPHSHLFDENEWTHVGIAHPLDLDDGAYHITVRALNKVEFGGPLATTVCHTTPYIIDNTAPIVYHIRLVEYDEMECVILAEYNVTDPHSGIREIDFGLGRSNRDVYLLGWQRHDNLTHISFDFCIPDGIPAWIKVRAINNVDLRTVGHSDFPVIVDRSPPIAGDVFDGPDLGVDIDYQSMQNTICVNWQNFYDEQSGISKYRWGVGTSPGSDDVIGFHDVQHTEYVQCRDDVNLTHNTMYYSTLYAFNAGHKRLNVSVWSNGVLVDTTPPVEGDLRDGLDQLVDVKYSSETATVSANWNGYSDPESDIMKYSVSVYRQHADAGISVNGSVQAEQIHTVESLTPDISFINWHHFHLHHGDYVYVQLDAINQADNPTTTLSDGYVVDTTNPVVHFLGDGTSLGTDRQYTSSTSQLSANWDFEDPESGVDHYRIAVYETQAGSRRQIHPMDRNDWVSVPGTATTWTSVDTLSLRIGGHYSVRVSAVNGAGLSTVHDTDGVVLDPTPPMMRAVFVGVIAGESEERFDGYVLQTDPNGIQATWLATDPESGILAYWAAVGTTPGGVDVSDYRSMGINRDGYIDGLELELYDETTNQPIYYVSVKAENGAGELSAPKISSPIKVLQGDIAGIVEDGPETEIVSSEIVSVDVDYQKEETVVTAQFMGFESQVHGISHYEWAVGTQPRSDDVQPYTNAGIVLSGDHDNPGEGLSGSGKAQSLLPLEGGVTYFASVRAITGVGNVLDSTSDGFTVDVTSPVITIDSLGVIVENTTTSLDVSSSHYQESVDSLTAEWTITEDESQVVYSSFSYGTIPGSHDVYNTTDNTGSSSIANGMVSPVTNGKPNILTVRSLNKVGLWSETISGSVTVDISPPEAGIVDCPMNSIATDELSCSWGKFYDGESYIDHYQFGIGLSEGDDSVFQFIDLPAYLTSYRARDLLGGGLQHQGTYYTTVIAYNAVGLNSRAFSAPIIIDGTPPIPGRVIELTGVDEVDATQDNQGEEIQTCITNEECDALDVMCQKSLTQISVTWQPFTDPETDIVRYQVSVGTSPGGTQLREFQDVATDTNYAVITGLDLMSVSVAYVTVKGTNAAGLTNTAMSNGVFISRVSQGLPPLASSYVWDGSSSQDLDYQENSELLSGQWDFSGDPCPIQKYEWSIMGFDGSVVQPMTELPNAQTYGMNDEVALSDGESYFLVVRATNLLGYTQSLRSDGITVQKEPLLPGQVRDGDVLGFDINYQPSVTTLSANWDGFGYDALSPGETRNGKHQIIDHYEVAAGTDRRFPMKRTDISPFVDVGKNKSHTFTDLQLQPRSLTYYITVRAYSVSTAMTEVTSNGLQVGYGGKAVSLGTVTVPRYIPSRSEMTISWADFVFTMPVMFYQWGLGTAENNLNKLTCNQLQNFNSEGEVLNNPEFGHLFDMHDLTNVGTDTLVIPDNLDLEHGQSYTVVVIATDESAQCSLVTAPFTVDTTPPDEGILQIGAFWNTSVMYAKKAEELEVSWFDYVDDVSGIAYYELALFEGISCQDNQQLTIIQDFIKVSANLTDYVFLDQNLQVDIPYYVHLRVSNHAGLSVTTISPPILLDLVNPVGGTVKDGHNYDSDIMYQSTTTSMEGVFLHLPDPDIDPCPSRQFLSTVTSTNTDWFTVVDKGIWSVNPNHRILFTEDKVSHTLDGALSITMTRDVKEERVNSGAYYYTKPDVHKGGKYQVEILAANDVVHAVTSMVFWDGPTGVVGDFNAPLGEMRWEERVIEKQECACCVPPDDNPVSTGGYNESTANVSTPDTTETVTISEDLRCECNCTAYFMTTTKSPTTTTSKTVTDQSWQIIEDELPGKTYTGDETTKGYAHTALGLQLHSGVITNGETKHYGILWYRHNNDTYTSKYEIVELSFDPSQAWHTYTLQVSMDAQDDWTVELMIDGVPASLMTDIPHLSENTKLVMTVWNRLDYVPDITDIFNPPQSKASFRNLKLPPSADNLCRFGDPFRSGDNEVEAFFAGVGSARLQDDVVPFRQVVSPCIPCVKSCDILHCHSSCSNTQTTLYHVVLDDINLAPETTIEEDGVNQTVPVTYYLTIKAITGSGRGGIASSDGVLVDTTPPIIEEIFHVDIDWSDTEPTEYQSSNSTITVRWDAYDQGSQVKEFLWAIGSTPGGSDIQGFISNHKEMFAINDDLELKNDETYYVTLKAINNAGLETTRSTTGVTVVLEAPDTSHSNTTSICNHGNLRTTIPGVDACPDQNSVGMTWEVIPDDNLVDQYYYSVSASKDKTQTLIPKVQVALNTSGSVHLENGILVIGDTPSANLSAMRPRDEEEERQRLEKGEEDIYSNKFLMEPGRVLYGHLTACNKGHQCSDYKVNKVAIIREEDSIVTLNQHSNTSLKLFKSDEDTTEDKPFVTVATKSVAGRVHETTFAAGMLSEDDMSQEYTSDASVDFKPFIANPAKTMHSTSRPLKHRIKKFLDGNFYLTVLSDESIDGKLNITVTFNLSDYQSDALPRLLYWHTELAEWHDSSHSCEDTYDQYTYDLIKGTFTVQVCSTTAIPETSEVYRRRRQSDSSNNPFTGPTTFSVASVDNQYINSPPVVISPFTVFMTEDSGTLTAMIISSDPDDDQVVFREDTSMPSPQLGEASLANDGLFTFRPCPDCYGEDKFYFIAFELRSDGIESLSTDAILTIVVHPQNDHPEIFFAVKGWNLVQKNYFIELNQEQRKHDNKDYRPFLATVGAYDVDTDDELILLFDTPQNGELVINNQVRNFTFETEYCLDNYSVVNDLESEDVEFTMPCNMTHPYELSRQSWVATHIKYEPKEYYYGDDEMRITVMDKLGDKSEILIVKFHIMENKCVNGDCIGPEGDVDCTSSRRSLGFDSGSYGCNCSPGYVGDYCETEFDECVSNPCPRNYSCIDQLDGFVCFCKETWPCAEKFTAAEIAGISAAVIVFIIIVVIIIVVFYSRHRQKKKGKKNSILNERNKPPGSEPMQFPRARHLWFNGEGNAETAQQNITFQNPVYDCSAVGGGGGGDGGAACGGAASGGVEFSTFNKKKKQTDNGNSDGNARDSAYSSHSGEVKMKDSPPDQGRPLPRPDYHSEENHYECVPIPAPDY